MDMNQRKVKIQDYIAGVIVANVPVWIINNYRDSIVAQLPSASIIAILGLTMLVSSSISGYFIARKTGDIYQNAGLTTGLLSFIGYFILTLILGIEMLQYEAMVAMTAFVVGAAASAKYYTDKKK